MILSPTLITDAGVVMLVVLVVLGFATTVSKTFRARHDHRALLRVRKLRPFVLAAMEHPADNVATLSQLPRKERDAFVALARGLLPHLRGVDRERLVQILETTRLIDAALRTADIICLNGPLAIRQAKKAIRYGQDVDLHTGLIFEREAYHRLIDSSDRREGIAAFNEKRNPVFTGR